MVPISENNAVEAAKAVNAGEVPGPSRSLAEAMVRVMERVDYVQKDKRMDMGGRGGYRYAGEAAFIAAIRPELVKQQITVSPVGMEAVASEVFQGKSGSQNRIVLRVTFRFTHAPTGETLDVVTCGEGMDSGDKATNKAMTGAMKYALRQAFVIETGDDPDDTPSHTQERAQPAKPQQPKPADRPDNLALRSFAATAYDGAASMTEVKVTDAKVHSDIEAGNFSKADIDAIRAARSRATARITKQPVGTN